MWGDKGSIPKEAGPLKHLGLVIESVKRYLAATQNTTNKGIKSQEGGPYIFYVEYDRFVSDREYRDKFYASLPQTTEAVDSCENILQNKVQLSSFSSEEDYDFNNRYKAMENDPLVKSFVTEEIIKLNEEFLRHALS